MNDSTLLFPATNCSWGISLTVVDGPASPETITHRVDEFPLPPVHG